MFKSVLAAYVAIYALSRMFVVVFRRCHPVKYCWSPFLLSLGIFTLLNLHDTAKDFLAFSLCLHCLDILGVSSCFHVSHCWNCSRVPAHQFFSKQMQVALLLVIAACASSLLLRSVSHTCLDIWLFCTGFFSLKFLS